MKYLTLFCASCVASAVPAKFSDKPIVTRIDDARPIVEPKVQAYYSQLDLADATVFDPVIDALDRPTQRPARDTNALDEVPDSTWFTNRIGVRDVAPEEAARGADTLGPPQLPFEIVHAKSGGGNPGFIATDARGHKYLVKFDTPENPGQQTATNSIVGRIFWTIGYHTPADFIVHFQRDQLKLGPKLKGFDDRSVDKLLADATRDPDGKIRATASQLLDGVAKGGWTQLGTREDDPNDRVSHEDRRVLRGLRVFAAWLNHTDMKDDNALDMYVGGHLEHYLVDFGEAFGGHQSEHQQLEIGFEHSLDYKNNTAALFAFGLWHRPWENQRETRWKQIGAFSAIEFDPHRWHVLYPYRPFAHADAADLYWGAKLVMRFDRPLLEALVATGEIGDPEAARYLVDVLLARRDAIGRAYLDGVTPLDQLTFASGSLCGTDLARHYGIAHEGELLVDGVATAIAADGRVCKALPVTSGYRVVHLAIRRADHTTPEMEVHLSGDHVVGLVR